MSLVLDRLGGRRLAIGLLALGGAALAFLIWWPINHMAAQQAKLAAIGVELARLEGQLQVREQFLAEIRLLERSTELDNLVLRSSAPALAGAELQEIVTGIIEEAGGGIVSIQTLGPRPAPPFVRITVRIELLAKLKDLRQVLHSVETREPAMIVSRLALSPLKADDVGAVNLLSGSIDVAAFMRPPSASP